GPAAGGGGGMRRRLASWLSAAAGTGLPAALTLGLLAGVTMFAAVAGPWQRVESANGQPLSLSQMITATGEIAQQLSAAHLPMAPAATDWAALTSAYN